MLAELFILALISLAYYLGKIKRNCITPITKKLVYSRDQMLSYRNLGQIPSDLQSIEEIRLKLSEGRAKRVNLSGVSYKENGFEKSTFKEKENFVVSSCRKPTKGISFSLKNADETNKSRNKASDIAYYSKFVATSIENKDLSQASFYLNEMDKLGLDVDNKLLDSYLDIFNAQRKPLGSLQEKSSSINNLRRPLNSLNPNAQDFNPKNKNIF